MFFILISAAVALAITTAGGVITTMDRRGRAPRPWTLPIALVAALSVLGLGMAAAWYVDGPKPGESTCVHPTH